MKKDKIVASVLCAVAIGTSTAAFAATRPPKPAAATHQEAEPDNYCPLLRHSYAPLVNVNLDKLTLRQLTELVEKGDADAMVILGLRYVPSKDDPGMEPRPPVDTSKALALFKAAAERNNGYGEYLVGVSYMGGSGVTKDEAEAIYWFRKSAEHGIPVAQFWIGEMTAHGRGGIKADWGAALPYFRQSAAGGAPDAFLEMGHMYERGIFLKKDTQKAAFCYRQSTGLGSQVAAFNLRSMIEHGLVTWKEGDPGSPPTSVPAPTP